MSARNESRSPKTPRGRHNKIYRAPPTPPPEKLLESEKSFVLDCGAVSSISNDYSRTNPKLGPVLPPYNSQKDRHTINYYSYHSVNTTLKRTGQRINSAVNKNDDFPHGTSIEGPVADKFHLCGSGSQYLFLRNKTGAGHSRQMVDGHSQFMSGVKPVLGFNGRYGYRRNTPWLRQYPSPFGTASTSDTHCNYPWMTEEYTKTTAKSQKA